MSSYINEVRAALDVHFRRADARDARLRVGKRAHLRQLRAQLAEVTAEHRRCTGTLDRRVARMKRARSRQRSATEMVISAGSDMAMFSPIRRTAPVRRTAQPSNPRTAEAPASCRVAGAQEQTQEQTQDKTQEQTQEQAQAGGVPGARPAAPPQRRRFAWAHDRKYTAAGRKEALEEEAAARARQREKDMNPLAVFDPPNAHKWEHTAAVVCKKCQGMKIRPPPLPAGWEEYPAQGGTTPHPPMFYHEASGQVLWEPPPGSDVSSVVAFGLTGTCTRPCDCEKRKEQVVGMWRAAGSRVRLL